jgi:hypothetical protein
MSTSPLSPEDIRAAAETHRELGPEYSDAVVASFLEKVDREVAARVDARLARLQQGDLAKREKRRTLLKGAVIGVCGGALAVALATGIHGSSSGVAHGRAVPCANCKVQLPLPVPPGGGFKIDKPAKAKPAG